MIDIENLVIDTIQNKLTSASISATVVSQYIKSPDSFPCVMIYQLGNSTFKKTLDTSLREHHAKVSFQIDVFSNKVSDSKSESKNIASVVDEAMQDMKFTRDTFSYTPNADQSVTRISLRYSAIVQKYTQQGSTKTHQIYRS